MSETIEPKKHHQLFIDAGAVDATERITYTLHQPRRVGPLISGSVQSRIQPQWNSEKSCWEWWYFDRAGCRYATSSDGVDWEMPSLGLYEWEGSKDNNIAAEPGNPATSPYHIWRDEEEEDPQRRYKGLIGVWNRQLAVSPDGFAWKTIDGAVIPSSDESQFVYDPYGRQFLALVKQGTEWGRSVWLSTSTDFVTFSEPELIFHTDDIDRENRRQRVRKIIEDPAYLTPAIVDDEDYIAEVYNMAVLPYQGLYLGFPVIFNPCGAQPPPETNFNRINQIELTVSRDKRNWERVADRELFIEIEPFDGRNYGTGQLLMSGAPVVRDDGEIWCYYNALRFGSDLENYVDFRQTAELRRLGIKPEHFEDSGALSLAVLRPDGFVSADGEACGVITTKPFELRGEEIYINADATWGEIYVEIADGETGQAIPGFWVPAERPVPFKGDSTHHRVAFKNSHNLVFDKPVRLRFYINEASLYSFWIE